MFTIENGLSQTRVNISLSDSYGYLWIGTKDGLNLFNGYGFEVFKHIPYDSTSLSQNNIRCITEDQNRNLWIGTDYGLNFFDRQTGKFRQYLSNPDDSASLSNNRILSVYADKNGNLWITTEHFLDRLNIEDNSIQHFRHYFNAFNNSIQSQFCPIIEDKSGQLWFGSNDGLFSFDPETGKFIHYFNDPNDRESLSNNEVLSVFEDKHGELWVGTQDGLNKFDRLRKNFRRFIISNKSNDEDLSINSIIEDPHGILWIGSNTGLILFDKRDNSFQSISDLYINKAIFPLNQLSTLLIDNSGIIWLSGLQGLFKIDSKPPKFRLYNSSYKSFPALSGDMISCLFKETDDIIWVGVWNKGLNMLNRKTGKVVRYSRLSPDPGLRISTDMIRTLYRDNSGNIWIGGVNGLDIFDAATRKFIPFSKKYPSIASNILNNRRIICMVEDDNGDMWFGTDKGVLRMQFNFKIITSYNKIYRNNITAEMGTVYSLLQGADNKIWIGTENGLNCYDKVRDFFYRYEETGRQKDLSSRLIYSLFVDSKNTLWIGTASGLNKFNPPEDNFDLFAEKDGLSNDLINAILEDENHCLWISTNKGLSKFDIEKKDFKNFDITEGLQSYEFNHSVAYRSDDGEMFFGGVSGFNSFYPENLPLNPHKPDVVIYSFQIIDDNGVKTYYSGGEDMVFNVKYKTSFRVNFAALDFTLPESNTFEYSLQVKGNNEIWIPIGRQNSLTFSNISPGEYEFKVRGSNNDEVWCSKNASIKIVCIAPVWRTKFALYVYVFLAVFFIYLFIQVRTKTLRKSNRVLIERDIAAKEISRQKDMLSLRNKNIEDSINYAQRIQKAMLTTPKQFKSILPESFIFHKPKDIVSGDFYWISEQSDKIFVAAADCTGHGVPGAFMSIISLELFRKIIKTDKLYNPAAILNSMNRNFEDIFGNVEDIVIKDGMDLSFCVLDKAMEKLEFSGAFNPIYIVRDNNLIELKGDRFSVGADVESEIEDKIFTNHEFLLKPNDMIYMFSDGYADQFGGPEGKKYKYRRFRHLLLIIHQLPLDKQKIILENNMDEWRGGIEQIDDILIIGIRIPNKAK